MCNTRQRGRVFPSPKALGNQTEATRCKSAGIPIGVGYDSAPSIPPARLLSLRDHIKTHFPTFSITHRVHRKRQRLPSNGVIESAFKIPAPLEFFGPALP